MKTAIYARVSMEDQNLESQLLACREWCEREKVQSVEYIEKISGGKKAKDRPRLSKLLEDIKSGQINCVVCYKMDRLGRSMIDLVNIVEELDTAGVGFVCITQPVDTRANNPAGRLVMRMLMACSEYERDNIKERTKAGLRAARKRGVKLGAPQTVTNLIDPQECRRMHSAGQSNRSIAKALNVSEGTIRRLRLAS